MLLEASPRGPGKGPKAADIDKMLQIMAERRAFFEKRRPQIVSLIGLRELERFVHTGLVGRVDLPEEVRVERVQAARREVDRIADLMESEPFHVQIGLIDDACRHPPFRFSLARSTTSWRSARFVSASFPTCAMALPLSPRRPRPSACTKR